MVTSGEHQRKKCRFDACDRCCVLGRHLSRVESEGVSGGKEVGSTGDVSRVGKTGDVCEIRAGLESCQRQVDGVGKGCHVGVFAVAVHTC